MRVVVTGAAGFIGKILCKRLVECGHFVYGVDISYDLVNQKNILQQVGLHSYEETYTNSDWYNYEDVDMIIHLAADSLLGPSVYDPLKYMNNNVARLVQFLDTRKHNPIPIIFASSAAVYGDLNTSFGIKEHQAGKPINPYGISKWFGEKIIEESCKAHGFKSYAMRFFNVAGAYGDLGQKLDQPHILTKMSLASVRGEKFIINGNSYNTFDGTCYRDYVHVLDVCNTLITSMEHLYNAPTGTFDTFNLGRGHSVSNRQLATTFSKLLSLDFDYSDARPGDPGYLIADKNKAYHKFGYKPTYALTDIIIDHYNYVEENYANH
jgi:UDP-glucose 4-epimerase